MLPPSHRPTRPPVGAHVTARGVAYRLWAPDHARVTVLLHGDDPAAPRRELELAGDEHGFFSGLDEAGRAGDRYRFRLDDDVVVPDPASRFQPEGVFGPSEVVSPADYVWQHPAWRRPPLRGRVLYELHLGAFTREGTYAAAISRLPRLAELGVNTLELMPLADFPGDRNWGYDGVFPFAPARCHGRPDELRALIDAAHGHGLAVVLDVVYNHLGPVGNTLPAITRRYFHSLHKTRWGDALNFDGPRSRPVRDFFLQNVAYWLDEYRVDGLRLDSIDSIPDESPVHLLSEIATIARSRGAFVIGEDSRNLASVVTPAIAGGLGLDGMWADDFHHNLRVTLTGERRAHLGSFAGTTAELAEILARGWFYRGQYFPHWERERGTDPSQLPPESLIYCISNHDQVGNLPHGDRLLALSNPAAYRAASMLLCLSPATPLLFMGQEWGASTPFLYFCEHPDDIGQKVIEGRAREFAHHFDEAGETSGRPLPNPQARETFEASKLDWDEREKPEHAPLLALHRDVLRLRAAQWIFQSAPRTLWRAWAVSDHLLGLRWFDPAGDWLLLVSLTQKNGARAGGLPALGLPPDEDLAPPPGRHWKVWLDSNAPKYVGDPEEPWQIASFEAGAFHLATPGAALFRAV